MRVACVATFAAVLLFSGFVGIALPLTAEGAANLVVERIVSELSIASDYVAFLHPAMFDSSDELAPYAPTPIPDEVDRLPYLISYELAGPTWFVWIDLQPYARYAHDTRSC